MTSLCLILNNTYLVFYHTISDDYQFIFVRIRLANTHYRIKTKMAAGTTIAYGWYGVVSVAIAIAHVHRHLAPSTVLKFKFSQLSSNALTLETRQCFEVQNHEKLIINPQHFHLSHNC